MTLEILLAAVAIAFLAAVCQSLTAFGFALVTVPLLALAWEVKPAVVTSTVLGTIILLPLLYEVRGHVPVGRVTPILIGSLAGIPLGVLILERIDVIALEIVVAGVVIVGSLLIYFSPKLRLRRPPAPLSLVVGGLSGHRYVIAHRHSEAAIGWGKITFDRDDELVVHYHDVSVPPEEEILAAKLILESRFEPWLRNQATCFQAGFSDVYENPFGDLMEGTVDAAAMTGLGMFAQGLVGNQHG